MLSAVSVTKSMDLTRSMELSAASCGDGAGEDGNARQLFPTVCFNGARGALERHTICALIVCRRGRGVQARG